MVLLPQDWYQGVIMGLVYLCLNAYGQYEFGAALYPPFIDWVENPIQAFCACVGIALLQGGLYYLWSKGVLAFKKWIDG